MFRVPQRVGVDGMRRALLCLVLLGACARLHAPADPIPPAVDPTPKASVYTVPWDAKDTDLVCADTLPAINWKPCMPVGQFRALVLDAKVAP